MFMNSEAQKTSSNLQQMEETVNRMNDELQALQNENKGLHNECSSMKRKVIELSEQEAKAKEELQRLHDHYHKMRKKHSSDSISHESVHSQNYSKPFRNRMPLVTPPSPASRLNIQNRGNKSFNTITPLPMRSLKPSSAGNTTLAHYDRNSRARNKYMPSQELREQRGHQPPHMFQRPTTPSFARLINNQASPSRRRPHSAQLTRPQTFHALAPFV